MHDDDLLKSILQAVVQHSHQTCSLSSQTPWVLILAQCYAFIVSFLSYCSFPSITPLILFLLSYIMPVLAPLFIHVLQMREAEAQRIQAHSQGHTARQWQRWELNSGLVTPKSVPFVIISFCLPAREKSWYSGVRRKSTSGQEGPWGRDAVSSNSQVKSHISWPVGAVEGPQKAGDTGKEASCGIFTHFCIAPGFSSQLQHTGPLQTDSAHFIQLHCIPTQPRGDLADCKPHVNFPPHSGKSTQKEREERQGVY